MHRERCALHTNDGTEMCSGTLKRGGNCYYKSIGNPAHGMMPTCKLHQGQLKISGSCRAELPCGFECGRVFEWKPYEFQLCPFHRASMATCYFLKMPTEMRLRVYRFVLPDKHIPARWGRSRDLKTDGERECTAILRVNRQIHDEAAGVLYETIAFRMETLERHAGMCNSGCPYRLSVRGNGASSRTIQLPEASHLVCKSIPNEPILYPQVSETYFNMIRSFIIELVFHIPNGLSPATFRTPTQSSVKYSREPRLYDYCDALHRFISRLRLIQKPLTYLEIVIKFGNTYSELDETISATKLLLQPFRRLRNVANHELRSITINDSLGREIDLLIPEMLSETASTTIRDYLKSWSSTLSSSEPLSECPQVFEAYWQLEKLVSNIREHFRNANPTFNQFSTLLYAARVAREAEDLVRFREIWDQVVNIWFDYLNSQEGFQAQVANSINAICDIVGDKTSH